MNLTLMTQNVRNDLMDLSASSQVWTDTVLQRQIDRTVARYSQVAPYLVRTQLTSIPGSKVYLLPAGAWWIDRIEYPIGQYPPVYQSFHEELTPQLASPLVLSTGVAFSVASGGSLGPGPYSWAFTYVVPGGGETTPSALVPTSSPLTVPSGSSVTISGIPLAANYAIARNIYRTASGGSILYLAGTLPDNLTTTFTDSLSDAALTSQPQAPTANTTAGASVFEMDLRPEFLPSDNQHVLELVYCTKHQLDMSGTSIPEKHWDCIELGAEGYALYAYLTTTNDNFDWVDGQFRDRVDDSKAPIAWKAHADAFMQRFEERLAQIKAASEATIRASIATWGDKPYRWDRL